MSTSKVDSKRRIVLPASEPGEIFHIEQPADGQYFLLRMEKPKLTTTISQGDCLTAMDEHPIRVTMSWDELKALTREWSVQNLLSLS